LLNAPQPRRVASPSPGLHAWPRTGACRRAPLVPTIVFLQRGTGSRIAPHFFWGWVICNPLASQPGLLQGAKYIKSWKMMKISPAPIRGGSWFLLPSSLLVFAPQNTILAPAWKSECRKVAEELV